MTKVKYLICTAIVLVATACANFEDDTTKYQELDNIKNTLWYSYDTINNIYYDIQYSDKAASDEANWFEGKMEAYDSFERVNRVEEFCHTFTYNYTDATSDIRAIVRTKFDNGKFYDGFVIPKGAMQISQKDVYIIQLYEVDEDGNLILTEDNNYQSTIMMWKE